jgi:hypothetical protein
MIYYHIFRRTAAPLDASTLFHGADMGILPISKVELTRRST